MCYFNGIDIIAPKVISLCFYIEKVWLEVEPDNI
jgi:hypothetical protein